MPPGWETSSEISSHDELEETSEELESQEFEIVDIQTATSQPQVKD